MEMNAIDEEASARAIDSLLNYETVKYFNNEAHEVVRYNESLGGYQAAALRTQTSLSVLNLGQNLIFSSGLTAIMLMASQVSIPLYLLTPPTHPPTHHQP